MRIEELRELWTTRLKSEAVFELKMVSAVRAVPAAIEELLGSDVTVFLSTFDGSGTIPLPPHDIAALINRETLVAIAAAQVRFDWAKREVAVIRLPFQTRLVEGNPEYRALHHRTGEPARKPQTDALSIAAALLASLKEALSWDPASGGDTPRAIGFLPPSERG